MKLCIYLCRAPELSPESPTCLSRKLNLRGHTVGVVIFSTVSPPSENGHRTLSIRIQVLLDTTGDSVLRKVYVMTAATL